MLNGIKVTIKAGGDFDPVPADKYTLQIMDVELKNMVDAWNPDGIDKLNYKFAILDDNPMAPGSKESTRGKYIWQKCGLSVGAKSWLKKLAFAVNGVEPNINIDPESLVGKQVGAFIVEAPSKKDPSIIYNNISAFVKVTKPLPELEMKSNNVVVEKSSTGVDIPEDDPEAAIKKLNEEK